MATAEIRKLSLGFTLVELIIVIVITSILAVTVGPILSRSFTAYNENTSRTVIIDQANLVLDLMARELRTSVPNSIRVATGNTAIEFMPALEAGRYREGNDGDDNGLTASRADNSFNHLGDMTNYSNTRVIVYNTSPTTLYADAVASGNHQGVITELGNTVTISDCDIVTCGDLTSVDRITLSTPHQFDVGGSGSPRHRFYLSQFAVTYHCDLLLNDIRRYQGYDLSSLQVNDRSTLESSSSNVFYNNALVAENVTGCSFNFQPGNSSFRTATVNIRLTMEDNNNRVELLREVHIVNAP